MVRLVNSLSRLNGAKIIVIGDILLDVYTIGKAKRISPEAPVAVVNVIKEERLPGGAGNVAINLVSLGAEVILMGRIGQDWAGQQLKDSLNNESVNTDHLVIQEAYPTPVKNRIIADNQQIVRIDHEEVMLLNEQLEQQLIETLPSLFNDVKVIALSDYGKGFLTTTLIQAVIQMANQRNIIVITDPKGHDFSKYLGTTFIKPNLSEAYAAANLPREAPLERVAKRVLESTQAKTLMITRSEEGISLFHDDGRREDYPVQAKEVKDVTGAGDTVLATLAFGLANELTSQETVEICNIAASIVIEHVGCARVTLADLAHRLLESHRHQKIIEPEYLFVLKQILKQEQFNLLIIEDAETLTQSLFDSIHLLSTEAHRSVVIHLSKPSMQQGLGQILASLAEVHFILSHSKSIKKWLEVVEPNQIYQFKEDKMLSVDTIEALS